MRLGSLQLDIVSGGRFRPVHPVPAGQIDSL
jgi:hypothetical protein